MATFPLNHWIHSLEGLMLKLKLQYFGYLMQRADSFEKTLMLGKIEGRRRRGQQRMGWLDGITDWWTWVWVDSGSWWWTGRPGVLRFMGSQRVRHDWTTELNWTLIITALKVLFINSTIWSSWASIDCFYSWPWVTFFSSFTCLVIWISSWTLWIIYLGESWISLSSYFIWYFTWLNLNSKLCLPFCDQ